MVVLTGVFANLAFLIGCAPDGKGFDDDTASPTGGEDTASLGGEDTGEESAGETGDGPADSAVDSGADAAEPEYLTAADDGMVVDGGRLPGVYGTFSGASYLVLVESASGDAAMYLEDTEVGAFVPAHVIGEEDGGEFACLRAADGGSCDLVVAAGDDGELRRYSEPLVASTRADATAVLWHGQENVAGYVSLAEDQDGDGLDDLLVGHLWDVDERIPLWLVGSAGFTGTRTFDEVALATLTIEEGRRFEDVGDVDGDGLHDYAVGEGEPWTDGFVHLFSGPLEGTLSSGEADATIDGDGTGLYSFAWHMGGADLDGDGLSDLVVTNPRYPAQTWEEVDDATPGLVLAFHGPLRGSFNAVASATARFEAVDRAPLGTSFALADLSGDGLPDIVAGGYGGVVVWPGELRGGSFDEADAFVVIVSGYDDDRRFDASAMVADLWGDGIIDLLVDDMYLGKTFILPGPF